MPQHDEEQGLEQSKESFKDIIKGLKDDHKPTIDLRKALFGAVAGALIGVLIGVLCYQKVVDYSSILWGLFVGSFGGFCGVAGVLYFDMQSVDKFEKENELRREALRRAEMQR